MPPLLSMSTPNDWITGALKDLGEIAPGQTPESGEFYDCLTKLNQMLDSFNTEGLFLQSFTRNTKVLTPSDESYTIGVGGDIPTAKPVFIESVAVLSVGATIELPIHILTTEQWANLSDKVTKGLPSRAYFQNSNSALGTLLLYPVPDQAHTLVLYLGTQLTSIALTDIDTTYSLAPGYDEMIQANLAVRLAPMFGATNSTEYAAMVAAARDTRANVLRLNLEPITAVVEQSLRVRPHSYDILTGRFI